MIPGDDWQMLMDTEEQNHEYLKNGKRYLSPKYHFLFATSNFGARYLKKTVRPDFVKFFPD